MEVWNIVMVGMMYVATVEEVVCGHIRGHILITCKVRPPKKKQYFI